MVVIKSKRAVNTYLRAVSMTDVHELLAGLSRPMPAVRRVIMTGCSCCFEISMAVPAANAESSEWVPMPPYWCNGDGLLAACLTRFQQLYSPVEPCGVGLEAQPGTCPAGHIGLSTWTHVLEYSQIIHVAKTGRLNWSIQVRLVLFLLWREIDRWQGRKKIGSWDHLWSGNSNRTTLRAALQFSGLALPAGSVYYICQPREAKRCVSVRCAEGRASVTANQMPEGRQSAPHIYLWIFSPRQSLRLGGGLQALMMYCYCSATPPSRVFFRRCCQGLTVDLIRIGQGRGRSLGTRVEDHSDVSESCLVEMQLFPDGSRGPCLSARTKKYQDMSQRYS